MLHHVYALQQILGRQNLELTHGIKYSREWAMPTHVTFSSPPISLFLGRHIKESDIVVDCFARNSKATYTNDLNPETSAQHHMDVMDFLLMIKEKGVRADVIIFDPPYSLNQTKEHYDTLGGDVQKDNQRVSRWFDEKNIANEILKIGGKFLHFGWHTNGMGKKRAYSIAEIMLVSHGGAHNDTICMVETKIQQQERLEL